MKVLIAAATLAEVSVFTGSAGRQAPRSTGIVRHGHEITILITGVGMVATAAWCSRALATSAFDVALNAGVCGSFDPAFVPGMVVHVVSDRIAELGAEDGDRFVTLGELGLLDPHDLPHAREELVNVAPPANRVLERLPPVAGITVNTVHGSEPSIAAAIQRFNPQVESMEGAAFMYSCLIHGVPFAQVRAVSNAIERRNRAGWRMTEAIQALGTTVLQIVDSL